MKTLILVMVVGFLDMMLGSGMAGTVVLGLCAIGLLGWAASTPLPE